MNKKSVKYNFIMNFILTASSFIFPLITFPYVSRVLGADGLGKINFAGSFVAYFAMFSQLGIPMYGIRECAKVRDDKEELSKLTKELLLINVILAVVSYAALLVALFTVPKCADNKLLMVITSLSIALNCVGVEWFYKAIEQYKYITVRTIIFKIIGIAAMFLLVKSEEHYLVYAGISVFSSYASMLLNFWNLRKYVSFRKNGKLNLRRHVKPVLTFMAMTCAVTIYTNLDTVMLGFMKTDADVGYYTAAIKIKTILISLVTSLGAVLLPRSSYFIKQGLMDEFEKMTSKALNFIFLAAVPLAVYFTLFAKYGVRLLSGNDYDPAILPMQVLMPTVLLIGITNILGLQVLIPLGREKKVLYSEIVGAVVDLVLNLLLIPKYAATGAAIGTLAAEIAVLLYQVVALRSEIRKMLRDTKVWKELLATIIASLAMWPVLSKDWGNFKMLLISAVIFFGLYLVLLLLLREKLLAELVQGALKKTKICDKIRRYVLKDKYMPVRLFFIGYSMKLIAAMWETTMFPQVGAIRKFLIVGGFLVLLLKIVLYDTFTLNETLLVVLISIPLVIQYFVRGTDIIIHLFILVLAARGIDFKQILRVYILEVGAILFMAIFCSKLGVIENLRYWSDGHIRNSLGIIYCTDFAAHVFFLMLAYYYVRGEKLRWYEHAVSLAIAGITFYFTRGKLDTACMVLTVVIFAAGNAICNRKGLNKVLEHTWCSAWQKIGPWVMPVCAAAMFGMTYFYDGEKKVLYFINNVITQRLYYGSSMLGKYGFSMFGQNIEMIGNGGSTVINYDGYNFVDCSYIYLMLLYGLIILFVLIFAYVIAALIRREDIYFLYAIALVAINGMIAHHINDISYNPFVLAITATVVWETEKNADNKKIQCAFNI